MWYYVLAFLVWWVDPVILYLLVDHKEWAFAAVYALVCLKPQIKV